jgi:hypothetical protein
MKSYISVATIVFFFIGCELYEQDEFQEYYVVESYLVANQSLPEVWLTKTIPFEESLDQNNVGVHNATVQIRLLNADHSVAEKYDYAHSKNGNYQPTDSTIIKTKRWYQLYITLPKGDSVEAKTFVPGAFKTVNQLQHSYRYQSSPEIEIVSTPSSYPGRQTYYVFTIHAQEHSQNNLTPFYRDLVSDKDSWIKTYYINSSDIINEKNFKTDIDGNVILEIPWSAFAFYGHNKIVVNAIDNNLYDFWRFNSMLTHEMISDPGEVQNIRYNVNGGIGIFGSMASDTNRVEILKPQ